MPSITPLVLSLSLDVTTELVAAGIVSPVLTTDANGNPITIVGATVTTPIVVTLSAPAPWGGASVGNPQKITAVIAGVEGMVEANGTWILTPTAPSAATCTLTTYWDSESETYTNVLHNSVGENAYVSGGTIQTALVDGRITLGAQHLPEHNAPPRIMMVPRFSLFTGADENDRIQGGFRGNDVPGHGQTDEQLLEQAARMVAGETLHFEVTCWAAADPPDPDEDFDALQVLYQQFIRSLFYLAESCYTLGRGKFDDTTDVQLGHKIVIPVEFATPVLDYLKGTATVARIAASVALQTPQGDTPEPAWSGDIPE